jgi:hypothetical protein
MIVELQEKERVLRHLLWQGATPPCLSTPHCSAFVRQFQMESFDE